MERYRFKLLQEFDKRWRSSRTVLPSLSKPFIRLCPDLFGSFRDRAAVRTVDSSVNGIPHGESCLEIIVEVEGLWEIPC